MTQHLVILSGVSFLFLFLEEALHLVHCTLSGITHLGTGTLSGIFLHALCGGHTTLYTRSCRWGVACQFAEVLVEAVVFILVARCGLYL